LSSNLRPRAATQQRKERWGLAHRLLEREREREREERAERESRERKMGGDACDDGIVARPGALEVHT
jgi:hypothetical protein